jgi:hypothetical protein
LNTAFARPLIGLLTLSLLQLHAAQAARSDVDVQAYVNDTCIVADEPYFIPAAANHDASDPTTAKFLPLLGLVIGKLAELFINHEIQASADRVKSGAARKDTRYAITKQMNLYRADFQPAPVVSINSKLGCMTIVAATFKPAATDCTAEYVPKELARDSGLDQSEWRTSRTDGSVENQLRRADVCVDGKIRAVYEARFEFSNDGTAYRLKDAGYHIESLLTTEDKRASRAALYTLKISNPGATDQQDILSSAWVNLGTVTAGSNSKGSGGEAPWLRVPPMALEARRNYEEKTKVHQEVAGEIEALKRALTRNQRVMAGLDQRLASAAGDVAEGIRQERTRVAVQNQAQGAELEARNAEYQDLPRTPLEFMPVSIEVAVTETESEKKSRLALADIIGRNSDMVGSAVGSAATGLLSRSVDAADLKLDGDAAAPASELERARVRYFDAVVEVESGADGAARADSKRKLAVVKDEYNTARRALGLEQIK